MLSRLFVFTLMSLTCWTILAQAEQALEDAQKSDPQTPEEPTLNTEELYVLQQQYRKEKSGLFAPFSKKLTEMLDSRIANAKKSYDEKKKRGNTKGMIIAKKAISIYSNALKELKEKKDFTLPKKVRKELRDEIAACAKEKDTVLAEAKGRAQELDQKYREKFTEIYKELYPEQNPSDEDIANQYKAFLTTDIQRPEPPSVPESNAAGTEELAEMGVTPATKPPEENLPPILATKGTGSRWVTVGKWTGDMMGMDVVDLPLGGKTQTFTWTQYSPLANQNSILKYEVVKPLPPNPAFAYRLKRIPGKGGVEVMQWPSADNSWKFTFRTERGKASESTLPLKRGFILQVSLPGRELEKAFGPGCMAQEAGAGGAGAKQTGAKKVVIQVYSHPQGAKVYIDGHLYTRKGKPALTPCKILIPGGEHNIKVTTLGYLPKIFPKYMAKRGAVIKAPLEKDPSFAVYLRTIMANAKTWTNTKIKLVPGDKVVIKVKGFWCCVRSSKDKCGPEGIPNDTKHYKYYANASNDFRTTQKYPYGALLMRLGSGEAVPVRHISRREITFSVRKEGTLFFDINEREGKPRKNNKGQLGLTIMVKKSK